MARFAHAKTTIPETARAEGLLSRGQALVPVINKGVPISAGGAADKFDPQMSRASGIPVGVTGSSLIGSCNLQNVANKAVTGSFAVK